MSGILLSKQKLQIYIGNLCINISHHSEDGEEYYLPESARPFLMNNMKDNPTIDLDYSINRKPLFEEPDDIPVAGFDEGPFPYRVYHRPSGEGYLWVRKDIFGIVRLVYQIAEDWHSWELIYDSSGNHGTDSFAELINILAYSVLGKSSILFHGVVMEWDGKGIMVCAHSGVGKTTHTRMWQERMKALILNGDRALCYRKEEHWFTCGSPWSGSSGEFMNRSTDLYAIVILEQADQNEAAVLSPFQGALELIQLAFAPAWDMQRFHHCLDTIDDLVMNTRVIKLRCRPDYESVTVLRSELERV